MSRRHRSTQVSEPICVGDVVSKLIEGVYDSLEPLKRDVSRVFANAIKYYGPDGAGRRLHEPSDCDDYVQRAQRFDAAWTSVAKTLKNPGREVKSPTPKKDVNLAALRCLDKLRDHRESDGRGGSYQVATPFLHANMLPTHSEYLPCIGGAAPASFAFIYRDVMRACRVASMAWGWRRDERV